MARDQFSMWNNVGLNLLNVWLPNQSQRIKKGVSVV